MFQILKKKITLIKILKLSGKILTDVEFENLERN